MKDIRRNTFFWGVILLVLMVSAIALSPVSGDAPYYISVAKDISRGFLPYRDINLAYTPLMMYINSVLWTVFGQPPYFIFILFQYLVILFSAYVLFRIAVKSGLERQKAVFTAVFFSICVMSSDGNYINLEVYSITLVLLAYLAILQRRILTAGMLLGLTFFFKQYGLLNFFPFLMLVFFGESQKIKNILLLCIGGTIPLILFLGYFTVFHHIAIADLLYQLTGQGYGQQSLAVSKSFLSYINGGKVFILLLLPLVLLRVRVLQDKVQLCLAVGMVISLVPVIVQSFQHYYLNAFPYAALLIVLNWKRREINWPVVHLSLTVATVLLGVRTVTYMAKAEEQQQIARSLRNIYPVGSVVYLKGQTNYLYILNDYSNPALREAGYSYIYKTDAAFLEKNAVITFEKIKNAVPEKITTVNRTKIFEY